ncbi:exodeoxyribonuclease VII small subunit [Aeromicrobium sp.]|nr:exodeoxyribonuclease VII small subunit [Candidatus Saccharibacteria bacterium]
MTKEVDYGALSDELETIVLDLQQDTIDVDIAVQKYERGLELISKLEKYLKTAENKIEKLNSVRG